MNLQSFYFEWQIQFHTRFIDSNAVKCCNFQRRQQWAKFFVSTFSYRISAYRAVLFGPYVPTEIESWKCLCIMKLFKIPILKQIGTFWNVLLKRFLRLSIINFMAFIVVTNGVLVIDSTAALRIFIYKLFRYHNDDFDDFVVL